MITLLIRDSVSGINREISLHWLWMGRRDYTFGLIWRIYAVGVVSRRFARGDSVLVHAAVGWLSLADAHGIGFYAGRAAVHLRPAKQPCRAIQ